MRSRISLIGVVQIYGSISDPESMQRTSNGDIWIGDEFGPYLLHFSADGVLLSPPISLPDPKLQGSELRSPQNQLNKNPNSFIQPLVQRSGGFVHILILMYHPFLFVPYQSFLFLTHH